MKWTEKPGHWLITLLLGTSLLLSACGGSDSDNSDSDNNNEPASEAITGTAATGAAIDGFVYVMDATGTEINVAIEDDGSYTATVTGMTGPFLLRAIPNADSTAIEYSFAEEGDTVANITPMTTLAMFFANDEASLSELQSSWSDAANSFSTDDLEEAQAQVKANFADLFEDNGVDTSAFDLFATAFEANNTTFDAVLDALNIDIDMSNGTVVILLDGISFTYDADIDTSGINNDDIVVDTGSENGDWTLQTSGTFTSGITTTTLPSITVTGLDAPESVDDIQERAEGESLGANTAISDYNITTINDTDTRQTFNVTFTVTSTFIVEGESVEIKSHYDITYDYTSN